MIGLSNDPTFEDIESGCEGNVGLDRATSDLCNSKRCGFSHGLLTLDFIPLLLRSIRSGLLEI